MTVEMPKEMGAAYRSPAQRARVVTEAWASRNLFCPCCTAPSILPSPANTRAVDFRCGSCSQQFQLKGKSSAITNKVVDGAYETMLAALQSDAVPHLFLLRYDRNLWNVVDLLLVPSFALSPSALECRRPLSATARRAGWIGCFIVLSNIPVDARIPVVKAGNPLPPSYVRQQFNRLQPLREISLPERGWMLDVLNAIRSLGKSEFSNADAYSLAHRLAAIYPDNRHIRDKIRQQLQFLRDAGFVEHVERGRWRLAQGQP